MRLLNPSICFSGLLVDKLAQKRFEKHQLEKWCNFPAFIPYLDARRRISTHFDAFSWFCYISVTFFYHNWNAFWYILNHFGQIWTILDKFWTNFESFWTNCEPFLTNFEPFWDIFRTIYVHFHLILNPSGYLNRQILQKQKIWKTGCPPAS